MLKGEKNTLPGLGATASTTRMQNRCGVRRTTSTPRGWAASRGSGNEGSRGTSSFSLNKRRTHARKPAMYSSRERFTLKASRPRTRPDALDREWESAEVAGPQSRHWVAQIKHAIREQAHDG